MLQAAEGHLSSNRQQTPRSVPNAGNPRRMLQCTAPYAAGLALTRRCILGSLHHMTKQTIRTPTAPNSALFSQAIRAGSTLYLSGMAGIDPATNQLAGSTIQEQTRQSLVNCENILRAAGAKLDNVVEVLVLTAD